MQKKIRKETNHKTKENVLNEIEEIENNVKKSLNKYRKKGKRNKSYCCYRAEPKIILQICKKNTKRSELELDLSRMKRGT